MHQVHLIEPLARSVANRYYSHIYYNVHQEELHSNRYKNHWHNIIVISLYTSQTMQTILPLSDVQMF